MKAIVAIIRNECVEKTKAALEKTGVNGITFVNVIGRGRQGGIIRTLDLDWTLRRDVEVYIMKQRGLIRDAQAARYDVPVEKELELGFLPKRLLMMVVDDGAVPGVVDQLVRVNNTGNRGDGKIFIYPVTDAIRIRTGEEGIRAIS